MCGRLAPPNNALQCDAHVAAARLHGFPRSLRSLGAPERGRWTYE
jgi:hypothetical protein